MKTQYLYILIFAALGLLSCGSNDEKQETLILSTSSIDFQADAESQIISIRSNTGWSSYVNDSWCHLDPSSGYGDCDIRLSVDRNSSTSELYRYATIIISAGNKVRYLYISQCGADSGGGGDVTLSPPTGINATQNGSSVSIYWNSVSNATNYFVYRSNSATGTYSSLTSVTGTSATDVSPLIGYNYYKVKASNGSTTSDYSSYTYVNYTSSGGATVPSAPTGVTVANEGSASYPMIAIRWNSVSGATSYNVYRSTSASGTYTKIGGTSYTVLVDNSPREGSNYYKVKAVNSAGESDFSSYTYISYKANDVSPCPVTYGSCTVSGTTITMRWTVPTTSGCGTPTKTYLRVKAPYSNDYIDVQTLSGTATSASFNYSSWVTNDGYVYVGIITENDKGTSGGTPKVYDVTNKRWMI